MAVRARGPFASAPHIHARAAALVSADNSPRHPTVRAGLEHCRPKPGGLPRPFHDEGGEPKYGTGRLRLPLKRFDCARPSDRLRHSNRCGSHPGVADSKPACSSSSPQSRSDSPGIRRHAKTHNFRVRMRTRAGRAILSPPEHASAPVAPQSLG
ncbi:hypothetical protein Asi02nite_06780 [Asanoa siamensis]|uniref:Uncharacterized protein n=1 Tax=Asanoa siamensis TaxID=926357 RepID=A0ABQ4CIN8_9ACTN|nr:hypothetical protein Asi02nite_06780 [Asanoa siamensis]